MKKTTKSVGIALAAIVMIVLILGAVSFVRFRSEVSKMAALNSGEIRDGIVAVKDRFVNVYVIKGKDGFILIDGGDKKESLETEFKKLRIDPRQVKAVFLTHSDGDHVRALGMFQNARVFLSGEEEQMVNGKTARFFFIFKNSLPVRYEKLQDNEVIEISSISIKGILTPGHTPGSMCYLVNGRHLFAGDSLSIKEGRAELFNDLFNMNTELQKLSLHKLKTIPEVKFIYTAHYGAAENQEKFFANW